MQKDQLRVKRATTIILTIMSIATGEVFAASSTNVASSTSGIPLPPPLPPSAPPPPPASIVTKAASSKVGKTSDPKEAQLPKEQKDQGVFERALKEIAQGNFKLKKVHTKEEKVEAKAAVKVLPSSTAKDDLKAALEARFKVMNCDTDSEDDWEEKKPVKVKVDKVSSDSVTHPPCR